MVSVRTPTGHAHSLNIARTCGSFDSEGGSCIGLNAYPNATISDYGSISGNSAMQNEIYRCGPIACGIDAMPLLNWESGIISTAGSGTAHVISIVGFRPARPKRNPPVKRLVLCPQIMFHESAWSYGGRGLPGRSSIHFFRSEIVFRKKLTCTTVIIVGGMVILT